MKCHYCKVFQTVPSSLIKLVGDKERRISHRYCKNIDQYVTGEHPQCDLLIPNKYFYCEKLRRRQNMIGCLYYHKIRHPDHADCYQVEDIIQLSKDHNFYSLFGESKKTGLSNLRKKPAIKLKRKGK